MFLAHDLQQNIFKDTLSIKWKLNHNIVYDVLYTNSGIATNSYMLSRNSETRENNFYSMHKNDMSIHIQET